MAGPPVFQVTDRYDARQIGQFRERGWWSSRHLWSYLEEWADAHRDAPFVSDGVRQFSYWEFLQAATNLAGSLRRLGIQRGDRVVAQLPNWAEFAITYLALGRIGSVLVPMMPVYRFDEATYIINHSEAVAAITAGTFRKFDHQQMFRDLRSDCPSLRHLIIARDDAGPAELAFDDLLSTDSDCDLGPPAEPDDIHLVVYTSGTESRPKGCCHTWNTFGFSARGLAERIFRLRPDDTVFMPSPVTHSTGLLVGVAVPIVAGASTHLLDMWDPAVALDRIEEHHCTVTASATPFVRMAIDAAQEGTRDLSSMRIWLCAGAPIPPTLAEEVPRIFPACQLLPLYGCSEVLAATSCTVDDPMTAVVRSDGRVALDGAEIRLAGNHRLPVAQGAEGEICYRGPGCMLGYWNDPERTTATIDPDGWYHTGDLGRVSGDGYFRVTGRIKDLVIRGGTNISTREVEDHLDTHPRVRASAVVGYPDDRLGERACAFVVPEGDPPTLEELATYLRDVRRIAMHKIPERLEVVDSLPMGATGKVQKFQLRARIAAPTHPL